MAEIVKCPNCNAQIHMETGNGLIKCEYCDTEIIINKDIITENPAQMLPYEEKKKAWNKSLKTSLITETAGMFITSLLAETNGDSLFVLAFIASTIFSFAMPARLLRKKPLSESEKINGTFLNYLKTYLPFAAAFWAGLIIEVILESL